MKGKSGISAAVLSGGKASRMGGQKKGLICKDGIPLIQRTISLLQSIFSEVILVLDSPGENSFYAGVAEDVVISHDIVHDIGPLGGIYTALKASSGRAVFCFACDMPYLDTLFIRRMISAFGASHGQALVPRINRFIEPLHALYKKKLKESLGDYIAARSTSDHDFSIRKFLNTISTEYYELEDRPENQKFFKNLNTPKDVRDYLMQTSFGRDGSHG